MHALPTSGAAAIRRYSFGLSGTGKTTLSADPQRRLIGDDEHGWSDEGVFNFEGGCYAKVIQLSAAAEPQIYACTEEVPARYSRIVAFDPVTRIIDLDDESITENTPRILSARFHCQCGPGENWGDTRKTFILLTLRRIGSHASHRKTDSGPGGYTSSISG